MVKFWSLTKCGLSPVEGPATCRQFRAALNSCGRPIPFLYRTYLGLPTRQRVISFGFDFMSAGQFRCSFAIYIPY